MDLRALQRLFLDAVRYPTGIDDFLAQADDATREAFDAAFAETPEFPRRRRMTVYAESHFWRLADVLRDQYRVVAWLAGPRRFHNFVTDYVWERPSTSPDVRRYGQDLPDFLAGHGLAREVPGIDELARVERSIVDALDVPDVVALTERELATRPIESWPSMCFRPAPWVRLWTTRRSYPELFEQRRLERPSPDPVPPLDGARHHVLVWRQELEVLHRSVREAEARALAAMLAGESFEAICSAAARSEEDDAAGPEQVVGWLRRWLAAGLVVAVE